MARYLTTWDWEQKDGENGRVMSGESFVCCHCGNLHDVVFGEAPAMCDYEWLPLCPGCSAVYHGAGEGHHVCRASKERLWYLDHQRRIDERRSAFLRSVGVE